MFKRKINVAFTFDFRMWMIAGVCLHSLCSNARGKCKYQIYCIVDAGVNSGMRQMLRDCIPSPHKIEFIEIKGDEIKHSDYWNRATSFQRSAMYRLLLPQVLPHLDKILYIDSDTIIAKDLCELDSIDIGDNLLGAVREFSIAETIRQKPELFTHIKQYGIDKLVASARYFNSGVLIMNLKEFRRQNITHRALHLFETGPGFWCCDQDTLNIICANKVTYIPFRFNRWGQLTGDYLFKFCHSHGLETKNAHSDVSDYTILHFVGTKPWTIEPPYAAHQEDVWWCYAARTPFYDRLKHLHRAVVEMEMQKRYQKAQAEATQKNKKTKKEEVNH